MKNFLKQELMGSDSRLDSNHYIKSFALTDSLYKGTALTANVLFSAILIRIPPIATDIILLSTYFHFLFIAILEIPTSFIADMYDTALLTKIGFALKFVTTLLFALLVFYALNGNSKLGLVFLIVESLVDGISNSLLSGGYQAAILRKLKFEGRNTSGIFVNSLRYSVPLRLLIPVLGILLFYFLDVGVKSQMVFLVSYVVLLRVIVFVRISIVLRNFPLIEHTHKSAFQYFGTLLKDIKQNKMLIGYAGFYSLLTSTATAYFLPNLQLLLSPLTIKAGLLQGSVISLAFYFKVIIFGWSVARFNLISNIFSTHRRILVSLIVSHICFVLAEMLVSDPALKLSTEYCFIFAIYFCSFLGLRKSIDEVGKASTNSTEAGLISSSETLSKAGFCILAVLGFYIPMNDFYILLLTSFLIIGITLLIYENPKKITAKVF